MKTLRMSAAVAALLVLSVALGACGSGGSSSSDSGRKAGADNRNLTVTNKLSSSVDFVPVTSDTGSKATLKSSSSATASGYSLSGANDVCVDLRVNGSTIRVGMLVTLNNLNVWLPAGCPGDNGPTANWMYDQSSGKRSLQSGVSGVQVCLERTGLVDLSATLLPADASC